MKKVILTTALVAMFGFVNAQTEEGRTLIGGSTNLSFTSSDNGVIDNTNNFSLSTRVGKFLMNDFALGIDLSYASSKSGDFKSSSVAIGPFIRYYFDGIFYAGAGYSIVSSSVDNGFTTGTSSGGLLSLEAGYPIWVVENIAIEPSLNYGIGSGDLSDFSAFGMNVGIFLYF